MSFCGLVVCGLEVCGLVVCGLEVCGLEVCGLVVCGLAFYGLCPFFQNSPYKDKIVISAQTYYIFRFENKVHVYYGFHYLFMRASKETGY